MINVRSSLRHLALDMLSMKHRVGSLFSGSDETSALQFVLFHEISEQQEQQFECFLRWLLSQYDVVPYSTAIERLKTGEIKKRTAAISFDDGLKNNLSAARVMKRLGVSGCFFVCPSIVGEADTKKIEAFCRERMLFQKAKAFMDWEDLEVLKQDGHEIGNHSQNHLYMMELSEDQFVEEVGVARDNIISRLGEVKHFAWPYGRFFHFKHHYVRQVIELGHQSCASGERGAHIDPSKNSLSQEVDFCLRRDSLDIAWPLRHCQYFLNHSSSNPIHAKLAWPAS